MGPMFLNRWFSVLLLVGLSLSCNPAESRDVPGEFSLETFNGVVKYARSNYLDSSNINETQSYVAAADAALRSLPTPLMLMTREFLDNRQQFKEPLQIVPGKTIDVAPGRGYLILVPDYARLETQNKQYEAQQKNRLKTMTEAQRRAYSDTLRQKSRQEFEFTRDAWNKAGFGRNDFEQIIRWIEKHKDEYASLPPTFKGEDPYKENKFGMHHVYFAASNGFLSAMDPHSAVLDRTSWDKIRKEAEDSTFEGIGAMLKGGGIHDVVVETPLPGSPALNAGLKAGDVIKTVDGKSVEGMPLSDVVKRIRGKRNTIVTLGLERPTDLSFPVIKIKRSVIEMKAVSSTYLPQEKVGVLKISSFLYAGNSTSDLVRDEYERLVQKAGGNLSGLVIDLRNNPGGFLEEAIKVASLFLPPGRVAVHIKGKSSGLQPRKTSSKPMVPADLPIITLINAGSASASEIVASALMDHNVALVVGERSFGKASVQGVNPWNNVIIKLTTARYYAPRGYTVQVHGVRPDIEISDEVDNQFPSRFREEDMWQHLPELEDREADEARAEWVTRLKEVVGDNADSERYIQAHKQDAMRTDYMLTRALAYMKALQRFPHPAGFALK